MTTGKPNGRPRAIPKGQTPNVLTDEQIAKIPNPPESLSEDGIDLWYKVFASGMGWLAEADRVIILELCQIYQDKELYRRSIELGSVPRIYKMPNGTLAPHPYITLLKSARAEMSSHLSSLGFTPTDRARIGAIESLVGDPLLEMIKRKKEREDKRNASRGEKADDE